MTDRELNALPAELASQLRFLDRKVRGLAALRGAGVVCAVLCAGVAVGVVVDWLFDLGVGTRVAILLGVGAVAVISAVTAFLRPLVRRTSSAELAALVDTSFPDLRERIESTVELADPDLPESQKGSPLMRSLLMRETVRTAQGLDFGAAADGSSAFRWLLIGVMALLLLVAPFGLSRDGYALMLSRFLTPWRNLERATNLYFEVAEGDRTVARGDDVTIKAVPKWRLSPGRPPEYAWLNWQNSSGERDQRRMEWSASEEAYVATLPHVFTSFDYDVSSEGARTRQFHIDVVERPDITRLALEIVPPAYTGQPARSLDGAVGRTEVFERSELTFDVDFNKPVRTAELVWLDDERTAPAEVEKVGADDLDRLPLTLNAEGTAGRLTFEAERTGPYAILLRDSHELESQPSVSRELVIVFDAPPQVAWSDLDPAQIVNIPPIEARPDDHVPLSVRASDDIGIVDLELHIEVIQRGELLGPVAAESPLLGRPLVTHGFDLTLKSYDLKQGDLLSVRARGVDGRPVPGPQEGWSPARLIRINKDAEPSGLQALMAEQQKLRGTIEQLREDVQQDREQVRELESEALQKQQENAPFQRQSDVADLAQSEREIQQRIEQLAAAFGAHPLQRTIAEQTRQIASEPIERARDNLQQAQQAEPKNISEQRDRLRKAIGDLSEADERLEQLMQKFDELAALERDLQQLQRLAEQAERLTNDVEQFEQDRKELERLKKEQALNEREQQQQQQQLAERQMDLQDEQQDLASALDHLLDERPEILEAARQQQLRQLQDLAERADELAAHQQRLAEALGREPEQPRPPQPDRPPPPHTPAADRPKVTDADDAQPQQAAQATPQQPDGAEGTQPLGDPSTAAQQQPDQQQPQSSEQMASQQPDALQPNAQPADAQQPLPETASRPEQQQPMRDQSADAQPADAQPPQSAEAAPPSPAERQRQLAEDAARQAVETARQQGLESEATQTARQFAEQALTAAEQAQRGLLEDASESARQAAETAQQTTEQMKRAIEPPPERMTQQSEALAQQQAEVAQQLQQAAQSPQQRRWAQQQGQQQIAQQTAQLAEQLAQAAQRMSSQPLNQQEPGQQAGEASQAAQQAGQLQQQATAQMQQQSPREAAEPARQAAESLQQAAQRARQASGEEQPEESPVPGEVGQQIAEARRELDQAAQQLQQAGPPQLAQQSPPGEPGQEGQQGQEAPQGEGQAEQQPGQQPGDQPADGQQPGDVEGEQAGQEGQQPGQEQQGQTPGSEGQPGQNGKPGQDGQPSDQAGSEAMRRVAESLQQAASQMGLQRSQGSQNQGQNQQSGDAQEGADGPQGGYGARGPLSLAELEAELGRISQRNWGQLPHRVESELQLSQQKKPDGDYARLIRMYFEDVARQQSAAEGLNGGGDAGREATPR
jgi:hypothetical protein